MEIDSDTVETATVDTPVDVVRILIAGLTSPYGFCPAGAITIPITNEMMHVWVFPGVDDRFGDIEDEWLRDYLSVLAVE